MKVVYEKAYYHDAESASPAKDLVFLINGFLWSFHSLKFNA
jgi:hypothetical protein